MRRFNDQQGRCFPPIWSRVESEKSDRALEDPTRDLGSAQSKNAQVERQRQVALTPQPTMVWWCPIADVKELPVQWAATRTTATAFFATVLTSSSNARADARSGKRERWCRA